MRAGVSAGQHRAVNPKLARLLIAFSYPLRLTAHLTGPGAQHGNARVSVISTGYAGAGGEWPAAASASGSGRGGRSSAGGPSA